MLSFLTKDIASFGPKKLDKIGGDHKIERERSESSEGSNFTLSKSEDDPSHGYSVNDIKSNKTTTSNVQRHRKSFLIA